MGVVKLADYQPQREVLESKVASLDDGYMRIATSIGKLKPKLKLAGREHQVLDAVIYCTFGWNKSEDKVTNTYLADVTGLDDSDVAAALNVLAERRIINLRKVGGFKLVSVNVSIDKWVLNKTPKKSPKRLGGTTQNVGRKEVLNWAKSPDTLNSLTKDNINTPQPPEGECVGQEEKPVTKKT
ncbi:TPA: replication protein, partial [Enterobacter roggenkampii]|nr:replication protein [Enterobacter roggenkampii]